MSDPTDHVFGPNSSNQEVFEVLVKPIVESAVKGFNGTIFAYGQTASGMFIFSNFISSRSCLVASLTGFANR